MTLATYKKRAGTSDRGKEYEWLQCAYYALTFATRDDVIHFEMFTNNEFFGDFDDVSLRVKFVDGSVKVFLLQLKHTEKKKNLTLNALTSETGDFSFVKYLKSYRSILSLKNFQFILYTNRSANFKDNTKLTFEGRNIYVKHQQCVGKRLLDTSKNRNCSIFKFESSASENFEFFNQFYLYVNQQNDTQLKETIADILKQKLRCDIYVTFVEYMRGWWAGNFKLTKDDVIAKLTELVFSPMIKVLSGEKCNVKTELIREAVLRADLTLTRGDGAENIAKIWREVQKDIREVSLTALKYGLTNRGIGKMDDLSPEKKSKVLWYMKEAPLIIKMDDSNKAQVFATIKLLEESRRRKKVVIIGHCDKTDFPNWKIFEDLSDLLKVDLRLEIVKSFTCRLQGKEEITLEELGAYNSKLTVSFRVSHLLLIALDDTFNIGEDLEELPPAYISRKIPKILLSFTAVDGLKDPRILLSCNRQLETVQGRFNKRIIKITCKMEAVENPDKHYIYGTENEFTGEDIENFVERKITTHHFRITDKNKLQWLESTKDIEELERYRAVNTTEFMEESELDHHFHSKVRILTSETGGGKTTLFKRIKNRSPPNHLVIKMNLKELPASSVEGTMETSWNHVVESIAESHGYSDFEKEMIRNFDKEKVILLWDSYDELRYDAREDFERCVNRFRVVGMTQWISSRNKFQQVLERTFEVFAATLEPFDESEQSYYIQERSKVNDPQIMEEFFKNINVIDNSEYLGVPLQLYILTDIFNRNPKALNTILTLTDMCRDFIDGKYTHFLEKTRSDIDFLGSFIEDSKDHRLEQYKIAALKACMPDFFRTLHLKNSIKFMEDVTKGDFLGLIVKTDEDGNVTFEHSIFGEYLCALWCSENPTTVQKHLYKGKYHNIKFMFDLLLAENRPIFVKILYRKYKDITSCQMVKDSLGRNPLHVICTYGQEHPVLNKQTSEDRYVVSTDQAESVQADAEDIKDAIDYLRTQYDPLERDELFDWTAYDYADQSLSLGLIEVIGGALNSILSSLRRYRDPATVVYYSTKLDYPRLFEAIAEIPYFEDELGGNLLHLSAEHCRQKYLTWLLEHKDYLKFVNRSNGQTWTPLHFTSFKGDLAMLKFLREKGGVFLLREPSLLSLSTTNGNQKIVEFLIESNVSPNEFYHYNYFTRSLTLAISRGYVEIVELLVKNGALLYKIGKNSMNALHLALENEQFEIAEFFLKLGMKIDDVDDHGRNGFHHAAMNNQKSVILFLLEKRASLHVLDDDRKSPLHFAAQYGNFQIAKILIDNNMDIQGQDNQGYTPLHMAVQFGHVGILRLLIEAGADLHAPNKFRRTPLHTAASTGLPECLEILCDHGASIESEEALYQRRPLHLAAWNGHEDCVEVLIGRGARVDTPCHFLYTPLHLAVEADSFECCQLLVEAKASVLLRNYHDDTPLKYSRSYVISMLLLQHHPNPVHQAFLEAIPALLERGFDINSVDENGTTLLHKTVQSRAPKHEFIRTLIAKGADITKGDRDGYIPLHCALQAKFPDVKILELLLDADDDNKTLKRRTNQGATALHVLAQAQSDSSVESSRYTEIIQYLLGQGAEIEAVDQDGFTPLHYAVQSGNLEIIKLFLGSGCRIDKTNNQRRTALHMAAVKGFVQIVEYLLTQGASIDVEDVNGDTPLDDSLAAEHPQVFKILRSKSIESVSIDCVNHRGRNALHMAARQGLLDLVTYFLSEGASVDMVDNQGNTPVDDALFSRHFDIFDLLVKASSNFDVNKSNLHHGCYPLHIAVTRNLELVEFLLEAGARVDVVDVDDNTPLHLAVQSNRFDILKLLVEYDDSNASAVNLANRKKQNVLHVLTSNFEQQKYYAIEDWVELLVKNGTKTDVMDDDGNIPFDVLFHQGYVICEDHLLFNIDNYDVDKHSKATNKTLLHFAVDNDSVALATWLVRRGASINLVDEDGESPLHRACCRNSEMAQFFLKEYRESIDFSKTDNAGHTLLHSATRLFHSNIDLMKSLVEMGVSVDATNQSGERAIDYALQDEKVEAFRFLLNLRPGIDLVNMIRTNGRNVLHAAAAAESLDLIKLCLEKGVRVNEADYRGVTPVDEAVINENLEILELLLEKDKGTMLVNKGDTYGRTLLHNAAERGNLNMVKTLVGRGARVDLYDGNGETAIDIALKEDHEEVYQFLLAQDRETR